MEGGCKSVMRTILTILLVFLLAVCRGQDTLPYRITTVRSGKTIVITGYAVMGYDTVYNRIHNTPAGAANYDIIPVLFLNKRKRPIKDTVIFHTPIIK